MKHRTSIALTLTLLAVVVMTLTGCASASPQASIETPVVRTISVAGTGTVKIHPDIATFSVGISETAQTTAVAQQMVNVKMNQILDMLKKSGIEPKDMTTNYLTLRPEYVWTDGRQELTGQRASQQVSVTLRGLDKDSTKLSALVDQLGVVTGIEFSSVRFDRQDKSQAYDEARELAVQKALDKAGIYARSAGMSVGTPLSISEQNDVSYALTRNTLAVPKAAMMEASGSADYSSELPTGELEISCTVYMLFEME